MDFVQQKHFKKLNFCLKKKTFFIIFFFVSAIKKKFRFLFLEKKNILKIHYFEKKTLVINYRNY